MKAGDLVKFIMYVYANEPDGVDRLPHKVIDREKYSIKNFIKWQKQSKNS